MLGRFYYMKHILSFGYTSFPGKASDVLKYSRVRTISNRQCRSMMSKVNVSRVFESTICVVPFKEGDKTGTCLGDSGSALVDPTGLLLGITSWGVPCAILMFSHELTSIMNGLTL